MNITPKFSPELDGGFLPASLWTRAYEALLDEHGRREVVLVLSRSEESFTVHREEVLPADSGWDDLNFRHLERTVKFLLWARGGCRLAISGAPELVDRLAATYAPGGERAFDADFVRKVFGEALSISAADPGSLPAADSAHAGGDLGRHLDGCRIGFDLGGSDRKCAAVVDGEVVFSEEVPWDPYFEKDPEYHYQGIIDSLERAAAKMPRVDAIGGSAAGVYVDNQVRVASLFRGVPDDVFEEKVRRMFIEIGKERGVPLVVVNDGDVTALAGSMSIKDGAVLGLAMGTSAAAGYVDSDGRITPWLSELAFVPVDYREGGPVDEWSGDGGCGVQYFSQQAVARLVPASGLEIDQSQPFPEQLIEVQKFMEQGDDRAAAIYRSIGVYLGYAIPHFARFYTIRHLLLLGRVLSGAGGDLILSQADEVLAAEFPDLHKSVALVTPDETLKRHGQAIAAASLPALS
jgi:predicted NBD/HSP70 family sugar kinase